MAPVTKGGPVTFRHLQCNVQGTDPEHVVDKHIVEQLDRADVICWNEITRLATQTFVRHLPGFTTYVPGWDGKKAHAMSAIPISWRTSEWRCLSYYSKPVTGGVLHVTPTRGYNIVRLEHLKTGKVLNVMNTHVHHHIDYAGRAIIRGALRGQNARAKKLFTALRAATVKLKTAGPGLASGDLNVSWQAEKHRAPATRTKWFPLTMLGSVAKIVPFSGGTHGGRGIDWVWTWGIENLHEHIFARGTSDHNPRQTTNKF